VIEYQVTIVIITVGETQAAAFIKLQRVGRVSARLERLWLNWDPI
jgi:hypothetical protein